jgi:hypothetical protein
MCEFDIFPIFSLPIDILREIFAYDNRLFIENGKYIYRSKIPKTDQRYVILSKKMRIMKSITSKYGTRFFPTVTHHIAIYDDEKDPMKFSIELEKSIKLYKSMYW